MSVETANFIDQLQPLWPLEGDSVSEGNDHLQLLKSVLQTQFPGADAGGFKKAIIATEDEIKFLTGLSSNAQDQLDTLDGRITSLEDSDTFRAPAGTRMLFQQTNAPTGWTKDTANTDNRALRLVSGAVTAGGSSGFTTVFSALRPTTSTGAHTHTVNIQSQASTNTAGSASGSGATQTLISHTHNVSGNTGSSGSHSHTTNLDVLYRDVILAQKA